MPFIAECQYCKSHMRATDNSIGMSATCPRCGNCFTLAPMANPPAAVKSKKKAYRKSVPSPYGEVEDAREKGPAQETALTAGSSAILTGSEELAASTPTESNATLRTDDDEPPLDDDRARVPATPADDDADETPFARPRRLRRPLSKLGALAFLCGSVGLLLAQFPLLQVAVLPLAGLGLVFGLIGYVVAANSRQRLIVLPVLGAVVSAVVLLIAGLLPSWIGMDRRAREVADQVQASKQVVLPLRGDVTSSPKTVEEGGWIDASSGVLQQNDLRLAVLGAMVDFAQIKVEGKQKLAKEKFLIVYLRIQNVGAARRIPYLSWSITGAGSEKTEPALTDNQGKNYARKGFGPDVEVPGRMRKAEINPGRFVDDVLFFEAPPATVDYVRLELPLAACETPGKCRLQIPKSMIQWRNKVVK